ncbi:SDR family oxidoreductase [Streptomyces sp. enrichment culture]|uniref:SDR family oxidoreductase n=1 Tax=Streptomyces sp. enrichment culture TaxID=1795815 RepID=UPI003F570D66
MHVFVTGPTGSIGSAVVTELIASGHRVSGLARSDASADALAAAGAEVRRGTLDDRDLLRAAADAADGTIHLAFDHAKALGGDFRTAAAEQRSAVEAFGEALAGSGRPLVVAVGTGGIAPEGIVATERDGHEIDPAEVGANSPAARLATAELALSFASRGIRSSIVRLPPTAHGEGDPAFIAELVGIARRTGASGYLGDGSNRWPAVHRLDAAHLFRLALERAQAGTTLHAVAEEGVPFRSVAEVIGRHLGVPVSPVAAEDADRHFDWLGGLVGLDIPVSGALTRDALGWQPVRPGVLDDLEQGHYFRSSVAPG